MRDQFLHSTGKVLKEELFYQQQFPVFHVVEKQEKDKSSHQKCSVKEDVLKNFTKITGNHLCQSLFCYKVAGLRPATLSKKKDTVA